MYVLHIMLNTTKYMISQTKLPFLKKGKKNAPSVRVLLKKSVPTKVVINLI